ncbi:MAG: transketolase C-terminal domain-containing protein [Actinomycetota bacterium]
MITDRPDDLDPVEVALLDGIAALGPTDAAPPVALDGLGAADLFEVQVTSRLLDHTARWLRGRGRGYYTIGSAGHESNAAVAAALRPTDPALLHYRSGGFYVGRARQVPGSDPVGDVLAGVLALRSEPIAGGRHKVFGHPDLHVIPQTSTIASHLPRAVGLARGLAMAAELGVASPWPDDAVVVCSFGDASLNHSTAQGALNWAALAAHRGDPCPMLFVCEDNGLGISVPSPDGWPLAALRSRSGLEVVDADGAEPDEVLAAASALVDEIRTTRRPGVLHLRTVRFLGHAGTDVESAYRSRADVLADLDRDPILGTARLLVERCGHEVDDLVRWYLAEREVVRARAVELAGGEELSSAEEVIAPLAPRRPVRVCEAAEALAAPVAGADRLTLAQTINAALGQVLESVPEAVVFGEDVAVKGGVYGVTRGLQKRFGAGRVFDTHLDETSILGLALGTSLTGLLPIPEIQYLAYLHNAEDQLRGEAASLRFFSNGQYENPMVVRIAGYAYQRGFGGHFHNDHSVAVLRDVPGLVIASPSHPADAAAMLRTCVASALVDGSVCAFVEPIARYHGTDLHADGDRGWTAPFDPNGHVPVGAGRTHGNGRDLTIVSWANGACLSLRAQRRLAIEHGLRTRVLDLRWLAPLPLDDLAREASATGRVLVVDETRRSGGVGEAVLAALVDAGFRGPMARVAAPDSFVPLGDAAHHVLVSEADVVAAATELAGR